MPEPFVVRLVPGSEVVALRQRLLRPDRPAVDSIYPGDDDPTTLHLGIRYLNGETLLACGTFLRDPFRGEPAWRLRGMAVEQTLQRAGLGGRVLREAERLLRERGHANLLWCNARGPAIGFYERHGWQVAGEPFEIAGVGPHVEMTRRL